jgi:hypothetical protein
MTRSAERRSDAPPASPAPARATEAEPSLATVRVGVVEGAADAFLSVRLGDRRVLARRATSCLVEPLVADRVLVAEEADQAFVLAILEREGGAATTIAPEGDLEVAPRGKFVVTAPAGVHLATARDMTLSATRLESVVDEAALVWKTVRLAGRAVLAEVQKTEIVSDDATSIVGRFVQRAKRVIRVVEGMETLRTGQLDVQAESNLRMHGQTSIVTASDLVKVDGKQIQLG